jgi:hypothetical protein
MAKFKSEKFEEKRLIGMTPRKNQAECVNKAQREFFSIYSVFQWFRQAKFDNDGSILSSSRNLLLPQLPQKMKLSSKSSRLTSNN